MSDYKQTLGSKRQPEKKFAGWVVTLYCNEKRCIGTGEKIVKQKESCVMVVIAENDKYLVVEYGVGIKKYILQYNDTTIGDDIALSYNKEEIMEKFHELTSREK